MTKSDKMELAPWMANGRWYHMSIESDGIDIKVTTSDLEGVEISGQYAIFPEGYHIIDRKMDVNTILTSSDTTFLQPLMAKADGRQAFALPNKTCFDYADFWIFAHRK